MVPVFSLSRAYPNFNKSSLTETGEYDPTLQYGATQPGGPQGGKPPPYYGQPGVPAGPAGGGLGPIQVQVQVDGIVVSSPDISDKLALAIAQALDRIENGLAGGGQSYRMGTHVFGGDYI